MEEHVSLTRVATRCFFRSQSRDGGVSNCSVDLTTKGSRLRSRDTCKDHGIQLSGDVDLKHGTNRLILRNLGQ